MCQRCGWVNPKNEVYIKYHDEEWGVPIYEDNALYELFLLETFQAGLSWECVLNKREHFRAAFDGFDVQKIAAYDEEKLDALYRNPSIIRNGRKLRAAVENSRVFLSIQKEFGSFSRYLWAFNNGQILHEPYTLRTTSPLSDAISKDLKSRGMSFVGSTTVYSYLQAMGMIQGHSQDCFLFSE